VPKKTRLVACERARQPAFTVRDARKPHLQRVGLDVLHRAALRIGLARERAVVDLEVLGVDDATVRRDFVA
jgi:hypothetical protein